MFELGIPIFFIKIQNYSIGGVPLISGIAHCLPRPHDCFQAYQLNSIILYASAPHARSKALLVAEFVLRSKYKNKSNTHTHTHKKKKKKKKRK